MLRRLSSAKKGSSWLSSVSRSVRFGSTEATSDCLLFSSQARRKAYANMLAMTAVAASGAVGAACLADAAQRNGFPPATVAYAEDDMSFPLHDEAHAKQQENSQGGQVSWQNPTLIWLLWALSLRLWALFDE